MKKSYLIQFSLVILFLSIGMTGFGQNILEWNFYTPTASTAKEATFNATLNSTTFLETSTLKRGAGAPALGGCSYGFVGNLTVSSNKAAAIANNAYYEFNVKAKSGFFLFLTAIKANIRIQTYAAKTYQWMYSLDGGASFIEIGSPVTPPVTEIDVNNGVMQPSISLTSISALQEISSSVSVVFRLYAWGGTTPTGSDPNPTYLNFGFGKSTSTIPSLAIEGSVVDENTFLTAFQFYGTSGNSAYYYATSKNSNVELSCLTRGSGAPASATVTNSFVAVMTPSVDKAAAITNNAYMEFKVKPKTGYYLSLTDLDFNLRISSATLSAMNYQFMYSIDGTNFNDIGSPAILTDIAANGVFQPTIDLAQFADLKNITSSTTVTFRMCAWGGTTGSIGFGKSGSNGDVPTLIVGGIVTGSPANVSSNAKIAGWDLSGLSGTVSTAVNATSYHTNIDIPELSRGAGLSPASFNFAYVSTTSVNPDKTTAIANSEYYQLKIPPKSGYKMSLSTLKYKFRCVASGPLNYRWAYSKDGGSTFTDIGDADAVNMVSLGGTDYQIDLSGISDLQNVKSTIQLRMYVWGATSSTAVSGYGRYLTSSSSIGAPINSIYLRGKVELSSFNVSAAMNSSSFQDCPTCDVYVSNGGELNNDANKSFNSITINAGGKFTNFENKSLSTTTLNLNNDATGSATFIDNGTSTITTAKVQQYLTSGRNWYVSVPVTSAASSALSSATSVVCWDETIGDWVSPALSALNPMRGYISVNTTTSGNIMFSGQLNNGEKYIDLSYTTGKTKAGFNLVGNPYPSYVNWTTDIANASNALTTIWYRTKVDGVYDFHTYNADGNVGSPLTVTGQIPPMQAFWVRVKAGGGRLTFNNSMRTHGTASIPLKAPAVTTSAGEQKIVRIQVTNHTNTDETVVYFNAKASDGFDSFDSPKMSNNNNVVPEIFTFADKEELVINGLNDSNTERVIPLGFRTGEANNFSISLNELKNFGADIQVLLRDNLENTEQDITAGNSYDFSSEVTNTTERFSLILRNKQVTTKTSGVADNSFRYKVLADNTVLVNYAGIAGEKAKISVYNASGQLLEQSGLNGDAVLLTKCNNAGVYFIKLLVDDNNVSTAKIIIR